MFCVYDTFNDKIVSRHRTVEAAQKADDKLQNSLRGNSYLPTQIRELVKGKPVVIAVTEQDVGECEDEIVNAVLAADLWGPVEVCDAVLAVARAGGDWKAELAKAIANDANEGE